MIVGSAIRIRRSSVTFPFSSSEYCVDTDEDRFPTSTFAIVFGHFVILLSKVSVRFMKCRNFVFFKL